MRRLSLFALLLSFSIAGCSPAAGPGKGAGQGGGGSGTSGTNKSGQNEPPPPPCHPGCFPAGTLVETPSGTRAIETIGPGDEVLLVGSDGKATSGAVRSVFQTGNRLVEVRTESGAILTTETQPFLLPEGAFQPAGNLTPGDVLWRWENGERQQVKVVAVSPTNREAQVFNLVVGDSAVFVAGGYLVRGKPPLDVASK